MAVLDSSFVPQPLPKGAPKLKNADPAPCPRGPLENLGGNVTSKASSLSSNSYACSCCSSIDEMSSRLDARAKEPGALPAVKAGRSASQGELVKVTIFHLGVSEYVMGLANALAQGIDVEIIHPLNLEKVCSSIANNNVELTSFSKPSLRRDPRNLAAIKRALDLIKRSRPDILHDKSRSTMLMIFIVSLLGCHHW